MYWRQRARGGGDEDYERQRNGDAIIVIEELTYAIDHHRFAHMFRLRCSAAATGTGNFPYAHIPAINF